MGEPAVVIENGLTVVADPEGGTCFSVLDEFTFIGFLILP
jgi:hypothetical protein